MFVFLASLLFFFFFYKKVIILVLKEDKFTIKSVKSAANASELAPIPVTSLVLI